MPHRWFTHCCSQDAVDPVSTFRQEVRRYWKGDIKGPFNAVDRERAGLTPAFYEDLKGEMSNWTDWGTNEGAKVNLGYQ